MGDFLNEHPGIVLAIVLAFGGAMYWAGTIHTSISTLKKSIEEIKNDIKEIFDRLSKISTQTLETKNPPRLNELGREVSEEIKASEWAEKIGPSLVSQIKDKQDYEIQKFSFDYVRKNLKEELQIKIEICAYEKRLVKSDILDVLGVVLRDKLLKLRNALPK
ncbi:MAG: hypothetical protein OXC97_01660 [Candidatus Dadabacteria bacterium]|nr:hypothetical protein [Candidatus Dadabacteria bacterium]